MRRYPAAFLLLLATISAVSALRADDWKSLQEDEIHDPDNPALEVMQNPAAALSVLAPDTAGNKVDWSAALHEGQIAPRSGLKNDELPEILELDIVMKNTLSAPFVTFQHRSHTEWMACENCHEELFVSTTDANPISMQAILNGQYCGVCHGAVSFPLTECDRCHNVRPDYQRVAPSGAKQSDDP